MASGKTAEILMAAFAHFLSLHNKDEHDTMLRSLEEGQPVSVHFSKKIHRNDYANDVAKMNNRLKKPDIQKKQRKKICNLPIILDMEKMDQSQQNHVEKILKSGQHNIKISHVMRHDTLLTAKADIYYKAKKEKFAEQKPVNIAPHFSKNKANIFKISPKETSSNLLKAPQSEKALSNMLIKQIMMPHKKGKDPP